MPENNLKSPEKHRKSGTSSWKAPPRCYKDNTFSGGKQIVLKCHCHSLHDGRKECVLLFFRSFS